jgi:hypothetical protein
VTPAELRVIEAARAWAAWQDALESDQAKTLWDAVDALDAERKAGVERDVPWSLVTTDDEVWSINTHKFDPVLFVQTAAGRTRAHLKGLGKPKGSPLQISKPADEMVHVRRGGMGQAVDMISVLWSAQTIPSAPEVVESETP